METTPPTPAPLPQKPENALDRYRARRDNLEQIAIEHVLDQLQADPNQDGDSSKWKLDGDNIIVSGQRWMNVNTGIHKGFGGVSLVRMHLGQWGTPGGEKLAMEWLEGKLDPNDDRLKSTEDGSTRTQSDFEPPERLDHLLPDIRDYLVKDRGLPSALIDPQMHDGNIYASRRYDDKRHKYSGRPMAVFMGPASAEIREMGKDGFKGCCRGSQTDYSGYRIAHHPAVSERILAINEAAVDALSYRAIFPGRLAFSTNGAGRFALQYRLATGAMESEVGVRIALDADLPGDIAAQRLFNALYVRCLLSSKLGIDPETVDEWMLPESAIALGDEASEASTDADEAPTSRQAKLLCMPSQSPHEMFLNSRNEYIQELPVHARDQANPKLWTATGQTSDPTIRLEVLTDDVHPRLKKGSMLIKVSQNGFDHMVKTLGVRRDRTPWGKDWNDALGRLGSSYQVAYEKAARAGFKEGPPVLPYELERLRNPDIRQDTGSTPPATSGRPQPFGMRG